MSKMSNADRILERLKQAGWEDIYDEAGIQLQQVMKPIKERTIRYVHKWTIKHVPNDSYVLDIGCGDGFLAYNLNKEKECKVEGIDVSGKVIASAVTEFIKNDDLH